ncbi:hypothetical protein AB1Y20_023619 [Prymnesium parvum]|uniref:Glutathione transferase n=1 Tax=Prymnesium parvum TaxID=97485 RepID=A0AB34JGS6_PRYPA
MASGGVARPTLLSVDVGNNPARCRMLIYHKGLEAEVDIKSPADYGGTASKEYRALNPQGKIPVLLLPSGDAFFEARVINGYLNDKFASVGPAVGASTPEDRALASLINQVHDLYLASPNSSDPAVTANQGALYKSVEQIDAASRAAKLAEIDKQLDVLEKLVKGPYAAGESLTEADFALYPTLSCFIAWLLPTVFGWANPMDDESRRPKLKAWLATVGALPAAQRVKAEVMAGLESWKASGRLDPIKEQVAANPQFKWIFP